MGPFISFRNYVEYALRLLVWKTQGVCLCTRGVRSDDHGRVSRTDWSDGGHWDSQRCWCGWCCCVPTKVNQLGTGKGYKGLKRLGNREVSESRKEGIMIMKRDAMMSVRVLRQFYSMRTGMSLTKRQSFFFLPWPFEDFPVHGPLYLGGKKKNS